MITWLAMIIKTSFFKCEKQSTCYIYNKHFTTINIIAVGPVSSKAALQLSHISMQLFPAAAFTDLVSFLSWGTFTSPWTIKTLMCESIN